METDEFKTRESETAVSASPSPWRQLGTAVRALTPTALLRGLWVFGAFTAVLWLAQSTWPALLPFLIGGGVAYVLLPFTNWFNRFVPRPLAVGLSVLLATGVFAGVVFILATVLSRQVYTVYADLPNQEEVGRYVARLETYLDTLPPAVADMVNDLIQEAAGRIRANFDTASGRRVDIFFNGVLTLLNAIGFILGFLIIPAWLLLVLQDQRKGAQAVQRLLPEAIRPDVVAVWRIVDRAFRTFLEGQVFVAVFAGVCLYIGLTFFETIGQPLTQTRLTAAVFAAVLQLIPTIGPAIVIGLVLFNGLFVGFSARLFMFLGLYVLVLLLVKWVAEPRIEQRLIKIHPALLVMVVVALSEFGIVWILLAAPITAVCRDLFVYVYGRLSNPPRPAGRLPDESLPVQPSVDGSTTATHTPLAYRNGRAARRSPSYRENL
jgi:predicted PurR-regulated permease PerM